ncbi:aldo/keto reductase [Blastococcus sp. CT_GayMR16]|uniref:aldo/keto reductase n=1 Tax=Blastococcus sp. CT_GayMR16 TaxID=2559607 RepID=UPI0010747095|nr:aldo/keto reductase [Blastococcus sp. CT_GayMR16]TFV89798.1 aldo/keto reductase [Blastococcus sp. CT_GayMR16]
MPSAYPDRRIADLSTPPIGFGVMRLAMEGRPDEAEALRTVHAALGAGVRLLDTAVNYGSDAAELGYSEALVARALASWNGDADDVLVVCKGGNLRTDELTFVQDASPENLRWSCETSLRALGVDSIGLYLLHAVDPKVPLTESMGALADLRDEGKIQRVGISNAGRRQLAEAQTVVDVVAVENQLSPWSLGALPVLQQCEAQGIAFLSWSPLGGSARAADLGRELPEFAAVARERGVSPQQVALAWALDLSPVVLPIPAARRPETILDSLDAARLQLTDDERRRLRGAVS